MLFVDALIVETETASVDLEETCRRLRVAALVVTIAGGSLAAALASASVASAAAMVSHSAKSGELSGGRLTLRGVSSRMTYVTNAGRSGTVPVRLVQRRLFPPRAPATGTLHVAGHRGGDEPTLRLSKPRYNSSRRTVSYRAKPLNNKTLPRRPARTAGFRAPRRFGAASLSIVSHPTVASGDNGGNDCYALIDNLGGPNAAELELVSSSTWDTDNWAQGPPSSVEINGRGVVESDGGLARGCHNETVWRRDPGGRAPAATFTIDVTWPWTQLPTSTCTSSNPQAYQCRRNDSNGTIVWVIAAT